MHQELEEYLSSFYLLCLKFGYKGKKTKNPTVLNAFKNPYWESEHSHIWQDEPSKVIFKAIHSNEEKFLSLDKYESETIRFLMYSGINEKSLNQLLNQIYLHKLSHNSSYLYNHQDRQHNHIQLEPNL